MILTYCRRCRVDVTWAITPKGDRIPVEAVGAGAGDLQITGSASGALYARPVPFGQGDHVSHLSTCIAPDDWRRR